MGKGGYHHPLSLAEPNIAGSFLNYSSTIALTVVVINSFWPLFR